MAAIQLHRKLSLLYLLLAIYATTINSELNYDQKNPEKKFHVGTEMGSLTQHTNGETSSQQHHHPINPEFLVFFTIQDLHVGISLPIHFPHRNSSLRFLPKEKAESIPFSSTHLPYLLKLFSLKPTSPRARAVEATIATCEAKPIEGEAKTCATSSESLHGFIRSVFGSERRKKLRVIRTVNLDGNVGGRLENYRIMEVREETIGGGGEKEDKKVVVACHTMAYPYAVVYCHSQVSSETKVFRVVMGGRNGNRVNAVAVCHLDTSRWDTDHVAFRVLGMAAGSSPVCHFFPADNFIVMPS